MALQTLLIAYRNAAATFGYPRVRLCWTAGPWRPLTIRDRRRP